MLVKSFQSIKKAADEVNKTIEYLVSDDSIDSAGDIIALSAWDLESFRKNPLFLWNHPIGDPGAGPERVIGRSLEEKVTPEGLSCLIEYAVDSNPLAKICWELALKGYLSAVSVAGKVKSEVHWWQKDLFSSLEDRHIVALSNGAASRVISGIELWEVSQVLKGANDNAMRKGLEEGVLTKSQLDSLLQRRPIVSPVGIELKSEVAESLPVEPVPDSQDQEDPEWLELKEFLDSDQGNLDAFIEFLSEVTEEVEGADNER